jgi:hypothetical protein
MINIHNNQKIPHALFADTLCKILCCTEWSVRLDTYGMKNDARDFVWQSVERSVRRTTLNDQSKF